MIHADEERFGDEIVVARGISKSFDSAGKVLDHVDLKIHSGECLCLMGANGAGKTTLCEILQGLIVPDSGEVSLFGYSPQRDRKKILPFVGVILQDTQLYKRFSVGETLELFASFYGNVPCYKDILSSLKIHTLLHKRLLHLSGGEKQKVYLACALLHRPKLLFLDEPTTGVDPDSRQSIWRMIQALKVGGCSILLTTHYLEEAEYLADSLAILDRGKILASAPLQELLSQYARYSTLLLTFERKVDVASVMHRLQCLEEIVRVDQGGNHRLEVYMDHLWDSQRVTTILQALEDTPQSMTIRRGTMEDVYMFLLNKKSKEVSDGEA